MKLIPLLALCALLFTPLLRAADPVPPAPVVEITDLNHVIVNGRPAGTVVDAITNQPDCARFVLDWLNAREKALAEAQADKLKAAEGRALVAEQKAAAVLGAIGVKLNAELATGEGPKARQLRAIMAEAEKPERERKAEQLQREIDARQRELDALVK